MLPTTQKELEQATIKLVKEYPAADTAKALINSARLHIRYKKMFTISLIGNILMLVAYWV